ncbi:MAG: aconitate hydratase B, partial [Chlorobium sp.]
MSLVVQYRAHTAERAKLTIPPLPLTAEQTRLLVGLLQQEVVEEKEYLLELFRDHISPGVDDAAFEKAAFLDGILQGEVSCCVISKIDAVRILGTILGGYNVKPLV